MNAKEFLDYTQECLDAKDIEKAIELYDEIREGFKHDSDSATMAIIFAIYKSEAQLDETSFLNERSTISELVGCFNQLKLYIRRYDFGVQYDAVEFIDFVKHNHISSAAIAYVVQTSIIHKMKVFNEVGLTLLDNGETKRAARVLSAAYEESKDDVTCYNLARALYCFEQYQLAQHVINEIQVMNSQVDILKKMIWEKLS